MQWIIEADRWPGPDRKKLNCYDEVEPSPNGDYAAVLYSCGEIGVCVDVGLLTLLKGPHDNPTVLLQPSDFLCYSLSSPSIQWLNGDRYFVVSAYIRHVYRNSLERAFTFIDTEKRTFAQREISLDLVGCRFVEEDGMWIIPARVVSDRILFDDAVDKGNLREVPTFTVAPGELTWLPWKKLGRKSIFQRVIQSLSK